jgi:hypothetical protein
MKTIVIRHYLVQQQQQQTNAKLLAIPNKTRSYTRSQIQL